MVFRIRRITSKALLTTAFFLCATSASPQTTTRPYLYRQTWYEALLQKVNRSDFDYGRWLEQRRAAFLDATVDQPMFWYSLFITGAFLLLALLCAKQFIDDRRKSKANAQMMADVYNHDLYSRQLAKEAIDRHNRHIEQCNRAFEMSEGTDGRPGWGETQTETLKTELQRVTSQLEATIQERNKLQEELRQKSVIVSDLSLRLDALSKKVNGIGRSGAADEFTSANGRENGAAVVDHINHLQEELYAERQKNKRLKG
jgi:hypothetical protein